MNAQTNSNRFLIAYNSIDRYMRKALGQDDRIPHSELLKMMIKENKVFKYFIDELDEYAKLRNAIIHNHNKEAIPIAEPHDIIVAKYEQIAGLLLDPPRALDKVAVKDIYTAKLTDFVITIMNDMNLNNFTHVPVIHENKMVGVFSENSIFSYILKEQIGVFDEKTMIIDLGSIISFNYPKSECFEFAKSSSNIFDIDEIFKDGFKNNKRIAAVFLTQNGKQSEKLLGIITPWDIQGYKFKP